MITISLENGDTIIIDDKRTSSKESFDVSDMEQWNITPYEKVGSIKFGDSRDKIRKLCGEFKEFNKTKDSKNSTDDFKLFHVYYDESNKCKAIEFFKNKDTNIFINGINIFNETFDSLKSKLKSKNVKEDKTSFIFNDFGFSVYSPEKKDIETILVFSKGYYGNKSQESLDLTDLKYQMGKDAYGANVTREILDFINKNKDKIKKEFLVKALDYYKHNDYGQFAVDDYGKDINKCTIEDMDQMIRKPFKVYADSDILKRRKSYFAIGAECILDDEHGVCVGFDKSGKAVEVGDHGYFL